MATTKIANRQLQITLPSLTNSSEVVYDSGNNTLGLTADLTTDGASFTFSKR